jgi:hypothetical protein
MPPPLSCSISLYDICTFQRGGDCLPPSHRFLCPVPWKEGPWSEPGSSQHCQAWGQSSETFAVSLTPESPPLGPGLPLF